MQHLTPLLFVAIRLASCAFILTIVMLVLRRSWQPLAGWRWLHCAIAGALLNAVGLMAPHVGLLIAPAAHIALVQSQSGTALPTSPATTPGEGCCCAEMARASLSRCLASYQESKCMVSNEGQR